jgi:hypothetical protein
MKIYIDENMPPHLAEGLSILEKPNNEGIEVYSIQKEYGRGIQDEDWIPQVGQLRPSINYLKSISLVYFT